MFKTKLLENTGADEDNGILKNATIVVPSKYLSNSSRSLEIPLVNFKIELKLKWRNDCVLWTGGADNANHKDDNIVFNIKSTKLCVAVVTLSARDHRNFLAKDLKDHLIEMNTKKSENKNTTNEYR